ncbi:MAG: hypothetical protein IPP68_08620 [Elusimicrobia bacterium]|nr:hypothetical protein [Elusimicrobiota bacterium]
MKKAVLVLSSFLISVLVVLLGWATYRAIGDSKQCGGFSDIPRFVGKLAKEKTYDPFLIVTIENTDHFIQFRSTPDGIEIDFPLITDRQKSREEVIRSAGKDLKLRLDVNKSADGADSFLDFYLKSTPEELSRVILIFFQKVYGAKGNERLVFETGGYWVPSKS